MSGPNVSRGSLPAALGEGLRRIRVLERSLVAGLACAKQNVCEWFDLETTGSDPDAPSGQGLYLHDSGGSGALLTSTGPVDMSGDVDSDPSELHLSEGEARLEVTADDGTLKLYGGTGEIEEFAGGIHLKADSGQIFLEAPHDDALISLLANGGGTNEVGAAAIGPDESATLELNSGAPAFAALRVDGSPATPLVLTVQEDTTSVPGKTMYLQFYVAGSPVLRIGIDGSGNWEYHIKSGASWVADL